MNSIKENAIPSVEIDYCDRCPARAVAMVFKENNSLYFCGHHKDRYLPTLIINGWEITYS